MDMPSVEVRVFTCRACGDTIALPDAAPHAAAYETLRICPICDEVAIEAVKEFWGIRGRRIRGEVLDVSDDGIRGGQGKSARQIREALSALWSLGCTVAAYALAILGLGWLGFVLTRALWR